MRKYLEKEYEIFDRSIKEMLDQLQGQKDYYMKDLYDVNNGLVKDALDKKIDSSIVTKVIDNVNVLDDKIEELVNLNDKAVDCRHLSSRAQQEIDFFRELLDKETNERVRNHLSVRLREAQADKVWYDERIEDFIKQLNAIADRKADKTQSNDENTSLYQQSHDVIDAQSKNESIVEPVIEDDSSTEENGKTGSNAYSNNTSFLKDVNERLYNNDEDGTIGMANDLIDSINTSLEQINSSNKNKENNDTEAKSIVETNADKNDQNSEQKSTSPQSIDNDISLGGDNPIQSDKELGNEGINIYSNSGEQSKGEGSTNKEGAVTEGTSNANPVGVSPEKNPTTSFGDANGLNLPPEQIEEIKEQLGHEPRKKVTKISRASEWLKSKITGNKALAVGGTLAIIGAVAIVVANPGLLPWLVANGMGVTTIAAQLKKK